MIGFIPYGNAIAKERLLQRVRQWVDLGMPSAAGLALRVYPRDYSFAAGENQLDCQKKRVPISVEPGN